MPNLLAFVEGPRGLRLCASTIHVPGPSEVPAQPQRTAELTSQAPEALANPFIGGGVTTATTLEITGCDRTVSVPLHAGPYPAATELRAERSDADLVVTWSAPAATSVLVGVNGGFGDYTCHDAPSGAYRFAGRAEVRGVAQVQTFGPPETTQTELGAVQVWYGEVTRQPLATP